MTGTRRESSIGSNRSDSSEPWDERPDDASNGKKNPASPSGSSVNSKTSETDMVRTDLYVDKTEPLEDGDLPALSLSRSLSGGKDKRTGAGYMQNSSNAQKSEAELKKQREFWTQLDVSPSLATEESSKQRRIKRAGDDNEMKSERAEAREDTRSGKKNSEYTEHLRIAESEESEETKDSKEFVETEHDENNFCDHTLSAMEALCGEAGVQNFCGGTSGNSKAKASRNAGSDHEVGPPKKKLGKQLHLNARGASESIEEHTAIEVEYVEPESANASSQESPKNWSPSRKNAYLAAMARKAKEDFERSQAKEMTALSSKRRTTQDTSEGSPEEVYKTFSASEKRKFLRLINSGLSSSESAERVRFERDDKSKSDKKDSKKGKLFKFWKKGGSAKSKEAKEPSSHGFSKQIGSTSDVISLQKPSPHKEDEKKEDDSGNQEQSVVSQDAVAEKSSAEEISRAATQESESTLEEDLIDRESEARFHNATPTQIERFRDSLQSNNTTGGSNTESVSIDADSQAPVPLSPSQNQRNRGVLAEVPMDTSRAKPEDFDFDGGFAKSGINYYDAVRQNQSESEDESDKASTTSPSNKRNAKTGQLTPIITSPKLKGFSKLTNGDKNNSEIETEILSDVNDSSRLFSSEKNTKFVSPDSRALKEPTMVVTPTSPHSSQLANSFRSFSGQETATNDSQGSARGKAESEAFGRVEQELLRPVANSNELQDTKARIVSPEPAANLRPVANANELQDTKARIVSPEPAANERESNAAMKHYFLSQTKKENDFNMQEYLNATDVYSAAGNGNDTISVMSGKSVATGQTSLQGPGSVYTQSSTVYTQSSTLTQSSRKRRPGAAKSRLAKAKEAEKQAAKKNGWHESIRAAAQSTNRVWKPNVGWVDYEEPDNDFSTDSTTSGKLHLNLSLSKQTKRREDMSGENAISLPSDEWEEEKALPTHRTMTDASSQRSKSLERPKSTYCEEKAPALSIDDLSVEQSVAHSVEQFIQSQSMRNVSPAGRKRREIASTSQANRTSPSKRITTSPSKRITISPSKRIGWVDSMRSATQNIDKDGRSWDPVNGWTNEKNNELCALGFDQSSIEERQADYVASSAHDKIDTASSGREPLVEDSPPEESQKLVLNLPVREKSVKNETAMLEKWGPKLVKPSRPPVETPIQELHSDGEDDVPQNDSDDVPLLNTSGDFAEGSMNMNATVDVIREKVSEDDLNWFPKQQSRKDSANKSTNLSVFSNEQSKETESSSMLQTNASSKSARRVAGPVDVDTVQDLEDSDGDDEGVVWDGLVFEMGSSAPQSAAPVNSRTRTSGETKSGSSVASMTSYSSKSVPKLSKNKRDTSPIRGHTTEVFGSPVVRKEDVFSSARAITADESNHGNINEEMNFEQDSLKGRPLEDYEARSANDDSTAPSSSSSIVKLRAQQWESKTRKDHAAVTPQRLEQGETGRLNPATAEWKSFLGKKVQAENEAAAREKERMLRDNGGEPRILYANDQNDSLFDFSAGGSFAQTRTSSYPSHKRKNDYHKAYSHANEDSMTEFPPSEGSDFSDGNEMNKGFFGRLATCAAPMLPKRGQNGEMSHLAFLQKNGDSVGSRFMPHYLCGRPDVIHEEDGEGGGEGIEPKTKSLDGRTSKIEAVAKPQYRDIKTKGSDVRADTRSVISEDFGAKTAYLEALAVKTAVSNPRRSSSRLRSDRSSGGASEVSTSTTKSHKEKWKEFLERKSAASGASPVKSRTNGSDASAAAESYAAKKVEEMMAMMASRSKSTPRSWRSPDEKQPQGAAYKLNDARRASHELARQRSDPKGQAQKTDSIAAAEALAAARVNAMMEALATSNQSSRMDEGEI